MKSFNCGLGEDGLSVIIKVFEPSPNLEELDIGANIVKSRGGPQLQSFLTMLSVFVTKNQSIRVLRMAGQVFDFAFLSDRVFFESFFQGCWKALLGQVHGSFFGSFRFNENHRRARHQRQPDWRRGNRNAC